MGEHALVQASKKIMEVQALFFLQGSGLEKTVEQPAFAAPHGTMQVKAGKGACRGPRQR
ncbi:hypothetical protein D3C76_1312110 [compost metagenome]